MKYIIPTFFAVVITLSACATHAINNSNIETASAAMALTMVAQTQTGGLVATVNAQGTQITLLKQGAATLSITPTNISFSTLPTDENARAALIKLLGSNDTTTSISTDYNDGYLAIGYYFITGPTFGDGNWIAQYVNGTWGIVYVSHGTPPCKDLQPFHLEDSQPPSDCLDSNGNTILRWQWQGQ